MNVVSEANETFANLFDLSNASGWNQSLIDDHSTYASENSGIIKIFFAFPLMGLMVMIVGSAFLRYRRIQLAEESARIYNARLATRNECARLRNIMRLEMVERALIKTTVVARAHVDSRNMSTSALTGSITSSSGSSNSLDDIEAQLGNETNNDDLNITSTAVLTLQHPIDMNAWILEPQCAICLEAYQENDSVSYSKHRNCSHTFHTDCILNWLKDEFRNDCPCCRSPYVHINSVT
eukprot:scaffold32737_cov66-Cyclotella_meneghiniana.AAC.2